MITARLFGGEGDGQECSVLSVEAHVTMVDGVPKSFSGDAHPEGDPALLVEADGRWEVYSRIEHLIPDEESRLGYWCTEPLAGQSRRRGAVDLSLERLDQVERVLARLPSQYHWSTLRRLLVGYGYPVRRFEQAASVANGNCRSA